MLKLSGRGHTVHKTPLFWLDVTEVRKYTTLEYGGSKTQKDFKMLKKRPQSEMVAKRTKTTANIPADLYGQMWHLIANERCAGRRLTAPDIMIDALRDYLDVRKKDAAA